MTTSEAGESHAFDHFLLTRFNVRWMVSDGPAPSDEWLRRRLPLFEKFTLASVQAGDETHVKVNWLVFISSDSPIWFRQRMSELQEESGERFEMVPVDRFTPDVVADEVRRRSRSGFVITTRLDNDDAVARDFLPTIQKAFDRQSFQFVNLVNGIQYADNKMYARPYTLNPFISLIEVNGNAPATVFVGPHGELDRFGSVLNIHTAKPVWLQNVHGENVATERVGVRIVGSKVLSRFGMPLAVDDRPISLILEKVSNSFGVLGRLAAKPSRLRRLFQVAAARRPSR